MYLVVSSKYDKSVNDILDFFLLYEIPFFRIGDICKINIDCVVIENGKLKDCIIKNLSDRTEISYSDISGLFYRGGSLFCDLNIKYNNKTKKEIKKKVEYNLKDEWISLVEYVFSEIEENVVSIGSMKNTQPNKLEMLKIANKCGLKTPNTFILSNNFELIKNTINNKKYISKPICNVLNFCDGNIHITYTNKVEANDLNNEIFPSLFQEHIDSVLEIRLFFFGNNLYPAALISDNTDLIDIRSNENVIILPYKLKNNHKLQIINFIKHSKYNTGSIDLLIDKTGDIVFLEVNPLGQFGFISDWCGFNLEFEIFKYLTNR